MPISVSTPPLYGLLPSDVVVHNNATERIKTTSATYTKMKETRIHVSGHIRVTAEHHVIAGGTSYLTIYVNDVARGTERTTTSTGYVETTAEDIHVNAGDLVQIWMKRSTETQSYCQNFKIKGTQLTDYVDQDPA